eukprot:5040269-Karenia_brevis.AAC.1
MKITILTKKDRVMRMTTNLIGMSSRRLLNEFAERDIKPGTDLMSHNFGGAGFRGTSGTHQTLLQHSGNGSGFRCGQRPAACQYSSAA